MKTSAFWNCFHDGTIEALIGKVPGQVEARVSIDYLRRRFAGPGDSFLLTLCGCEQFTYQPYDEEELTDLSDIAKLEPMVLSVETHEPLVINCVMGRLRLAYEGCRISTDAGEEVSSDQLRQASRDYWRDWSEKYGVNT